MHALARVPVLVLVLVLAALGDELCPIANGLGRRANGQCAVTACNAGYTPAGVFCAPCLNGTYKANDRADDCAPCTNAPTHAVYTRMAVATPRCPYECTPNYYGVYCLSAYSLAVLGAAAAGTLGAVAYIHVEAQRRARLRELRKRS